MTATHLRPDLSARSRSMPPILLFGVGAQRAGTTWLYDYLQQSPQAALPLGKQMDFFSVHFYPERFPDVLSRKMSALRGLAEQRLSEIDQGHLFGDSDAIVSLMDSVLTQYRPERYLPLMQGLVQRKPGATLTADITPEYAVFTADQYRIMRDLALSGGFRPRVVFLMRDPIERLFSQMRMTDRLGMEADGRLSWPPAHERFLDDMRMEKCERYTRYDATVAALEAAFPEEELFFGIYEDFFQESEIRRLTGFLDLPLVVPDFGHRANASPRESDLSNEVRRGAWEYYREVYAFAEQRFGTDRIRSLWYHPEA